MTQGRIHLQGGLGKGLRLQEGLGEGRLRLSLHPS